MELKKKGQSIFLCCLMMFSTLILACEPVEDPQVPTQCGDISLRPVPESPELSGPWPVGSKTVVVQGLLTEVWYPAVPGSQAGKAKDWLDTTQYMPDSTPDPSDPKFQIDSYKNLPLDTAYGPYPVIIFVHGTGSNRQASHGLFTHWASRGFVVLCCDNPGINLGDIMEGGMSALLSADQAGDTQVLLDAVRNQSGELSFLKDAIAYQHYGLAGHSAGGIAVGGLGDEEGAKVIIPMASGGVEGSEVESAMIMAGLEDQAAKASLVRYAYEQTELKKRLVHIPDAGHNVFLSVCDMILETDLDLEAMDTIAHDGCGPEYMDPAESIKIVKFASTAAFEETLMCSGKSASLLDGIANRYPGVEYEYDDNSGSDSGWPWSWPWW